MYLLDFYCEILLQQQKTGLYFKAFFFLTHMYQV